MAENVVSNLQIKVETVGDAKALTSLDKVTAAVDENTRVRERNEKALIRRASLADKEYAAALKDAAAIKELNRAYASGLAGTEAYSRLLGSVAQRLGEVGGSSALLAAELKTLDRQTSGMIVRLDQWSRVQKSVSAATNDNAKAAGLARHEWANLSAQLQDVFVMTASGASPFTTLVQQGPQIAEVFGRHQGGATAAMKEFGATALRVATHPLTLIAAGAVTAGIAFSRWKEQTDALTFSMNGLGRQSGLTIAQASRISDIAADRAGISGASARGLAGQFLSAGLPGRSLGGAIDAATGFSRGMGLSLEDAGKELAAALAEPAKGAEELAKKYGLVTFAEREQIKQIAAVGDKSGATAKLLGILKDRISEMQDPSSRLEKIWRGFTGGLSNFLDNIAKANERKSFDEVFRAPLRAAEQARRMEESRAQERAKELSDLRQTGEFAAREAGARSAAEREAIAAQKAYNDVFRQTNDAVKAQIAAENELAKSRAEAARKVGDLVRTSEDRARLARMSPFERRRAEIDIAERDFRRENLPNVAAPMVTAFDSAKNAATALAGALNAAAGGIGRLIPLGEWQGGSGAAGGDLARAREAIAAIESRGSGGYGAIGPRTSRGDRAYGRYQVMGQNIPAWTMDALGRSLTPQQFLGDPAAQDAVFNRQFGRSLSRYGNMNDAASVWFTGRPLSRGGNARDVLGTSGSEYVRRFNAAMGGGANDNLSGGVTGAFNMQRAAQDFEDFVKPLQDANAEINRQRELLGAQATAFGRTTEEMARATKQQELINQFQQQGVSITDELRAGIEATAYNYGKLAQETEDAARAQQRLVENLDFVRSSARDALGGLATDLVHGKKAADALTDSLSRIADRLIGLVSDRAIEGIFGRMGGGNLGGGGGLLSSLFGGIGKFFGFDDGGIVGRPTAHSFVAPMSAFSGARQYASGGAVPVIAHAGEVILNAAQQRNIAAALDAGRAVNSNSRSQAAPVTVNLIGAPQGTQVQEQTDSSGARRIDVVFDERVAAAQTSPQGAAAQRAYGNRLRVARR